MVDRSYTVRSGRSPYGERGLKYLWNVTQYRQEGRSPYGERGLKFQPASMDGPDARSLSLRRAWIEIDLVDFSITKDYVALLTESVD